MDYPDLAIRKKSLIEKNPSIWNCLHCHDTNKIEKLNNPKKTLKLEIFINKAENLGFSWSFNNENALDSDNKYSSDQKISKYHSSKNGYSFIQSSNNFSSMDIEQYFLLDNYGTCKNVKIVYNIKNENENSCNPTDYFGLISLYHEKDYFSISRNDQTQSMLDYFYFANKSQVKSIDPINNFPSSNSLTSSSNLTLFPQLSTSKTCQRLFRYSQIKINHLKNFSNDGFRVKSFHPDRKMSLNEIQGIANISKTINCRKEEQIQLLIGPIKENEFISVFPYFCFNNETYNSAESYSNIYENHWSVRGTKISKNFLPRNKNDSKVKNFQVEYKRDFARHFALNSHVPFIFAMILLFIYFLWKQIFVWSKQNVFKRARVIENMSQNYEKSLKGLDSPSYRLDGPLLNSIQEENGDEDDSNDGNEIEANDVGDELKNSSKHEKIFKLEEIVLNQLDSKEEETESFHSLHSQKDSNLNLDLNLIDPLSLPAIYPQNSQDSPGLVDNPFFSEESINKKSISEYFKEDDLDFSEIYPDASRQSPITEVGNPLYDKDLPLLNPSALALSEFLFDKFLSSIIREFVNDYLPNFCEGSKQPESLDLYLSHSLHRLSIPDFSNEPSNENMLSPVSKVSSPSKYPTFITNVVEDFNDLDDLYIEECVNLSMSFGESINKNVSVFNQEDFSDESSLYDEFLTLAAASTKRRIFSDSETDISLSDESFDESLNSRFAPHKLSLSSHSPFSNSKGEKVFLTESYFSENLLNDIESHNNENKAKELTLSSSTTNRASVHRNDVKLSDLNGDVSAANIEYLNDIQSNDLTYNDLNRSQSLPIQLLGNNDIQSIYKSETVYLERPSNLGHNSDQNEFKDDLNSSFPNSSSTDDFSFNRIANNKLNFELTILKNQISDLEKAIQSQSLFFNPELKDEENSIHPNNMLSNKIKILADKIDQMQLEIRRFSERDIPKYQEIGNDSKAKDSQKKVPMLKRISSFFKSPKRKDNKAKIISRSFDIPEKELNKSSSLKDILNKRKNFDKSFYDSLIRTDSLKKNKVHSPKENQNEISAKIDEINHNYCNVLENFMNFENFLNHRRSRGKTKSFNFEDRSFDSTTSESSKAQEIKIVPVPKFI